MSVFYIIAKVDGFEYLTKIKADSALQAEHIFLDRGIIGKHGVYGCECCMAYDAKAMKTDTFIGAACYADPVSVDELMSKIDAHNELIMKHDAAEETIIRNEKKMCEMLKEIENLQNEITRAKKELSY